MKRSTSYTMRIILVVVLTILTGRVEYHSSYHLDSWQQDRYMTVRVFGLLPVWRHKQQSGYLRYRDAYIQITGTQPDPDRWLKRSPDYVASLMMSGWHCRGFDSELRERRELLTALFDRFKEGMSREIAAGLLQRIDAAVPARPGQRANFDIEMLDKIRMEVGLEPRLKNKVSEATSDSPTGDVKKAS